MADIIEELQWRGLIAQHTDIDALRKEMNGGLITFYCGFDPTAPSLHHGHLVQLMLMRHLQNAGHRPIALVGGATGMIGDPRQSGERTLNPAKTVAEWTDKLRAQIERFLSFEGDNAAQMVNNWDWTHDVSAIDFLRDIGKYFRLGTMIAKDTVARRLASDEGISYTEFSYQVLQAYDYLTLFETRNCVLQTGGNDQWGNLVGGMDLIRKKHGASVHVLTTPIITKSDGTKFGKSEGGAIWLDSTMMTPYAFYQFWLNTDDADVVHLLKIFTMRSREEILELAKEVEEQPHLRAAQKTLAYDVTAQVHGTCAADQAVAASEALWGSGDLSAVDAQTMEAAVQGLPQGQCQSGTSTIVDLLISTGLVKGRKAARQTVASGGAYLNNVKVEDEDKPVSDEDILAGGYVLVRRGRRNLAVAKVTEK
ncbi:MAG: tyrosine--tRNA ligase [Actinomycetaceae bacterium]|nr:tyrosine--tRNA ligase [Actinomycetaceae bacterium]